MSGGRNGAMGFGRSKAKVSFKEMPEVTFDDVVGEDEAVEELEEIREFLSEPEKFQAVGAKIPKGVLLYGPPGTRSTINENMPLRFLQYIARLYEKLQALTDQYLRKLSKMC